MLTDIKIKKKIVSELGHSDGLKIYVNTSKISVSPGFKSIQMTFSLKPLHPWFSNFTCRMTRLQGFRLIKFRLVGNKKWPLLLSSFSPEPFDIFGYFV